jgi:hypothetical protein
MPDPVENRTMEWIHSVDRLPAKSERVLLYTPYAFFGDDNACVGSGESLTLCTARIDGRSVPVFTHWMPLPEMPGKGNIHESCVRNQRK